MLDRLVILILCVLFIPLYPYKDKEFIANKQRNQTITGMAEFIDIVNCIFTNMKRKEYKNLSDDDKIKNFFIVNRYMSKKYPKLSQDLNNKEIDKTTALDIWFMHIKENGDTGFRVPGWFWRKGKAKDKPIISNPDRKILKDQFHLLDDEVDLLLKYHLKDSKAEIAFIKKTRKEHGN